MKEIILDVWIGLQTSFIKIAYGAERPVDPDTFSFNLKELNPLGCENLLCIAQALIVGARKIAVPLVAIMVLYGAFLILTAGAKPDNLKKGRDVITWAIVGFIVVLLAEGVTYLLQDIFTPGEAPPAP